MVAAVGVGEATELVDETSPSADGAPPTRVLAKAQTFRMPVTTSGTSVVFKNAVWSVFSKLYMDQHRITWGLERCSPVDALRVDYKEPVSIRGVTRGCHAYHSGTYLCRRT